MMRRTFSLTIALGWAACFIVQAAITPQHPALGMEGAGIVAAGFAALASIAVAGLFLWLVTCILSVRDNDVLMPFADWVRAAFGAATLVALCGIVAVLPTGHAHLAAVGFLQLTALLASYLVVSRDADLPVLHQADNDNIPLGTRLLAWSAARESLPRMPAAAAIMRGERR